MLPGSVFPSPLKGGRDSVSQHSVSPTPPGRDCGIMSANGSIVLSVLPEQIVNIRAHGTDHRVTRQDKEPEHKIKSDAHIKQACPEGGADKRNGKAM